MYNAEEYKSYLLIMKYMKIVIKIWPELEPQPKIWILHI